jgi:hypothetical protein
MRTYWCVITKKKENLWSGVRYSPTGGGQNSALDIDRGYTVQAAFLHLLKQVVGEHADPAEYRMNVYDAPGGICRLPDFTAPADAALLDGDTLRGYADEHLIAELARRLQQR